MSLAYIFCQQMVNGNDIPPLEVVAAKNLGALFFSASEYKVRD
jgi:hypothetical protein